jgi:hypothetical protein
MLQLAKAPRKYIDQISVVNTSHLSTKGEEDRTIRDGMPMIQELEIASGAAPAPHFARAPW